MPSQEPLPGGEQMCLCEVSFLLKQWPFFGENYAVGIFGGKICQKCQKFVRGGSSFPLEVSSMGRDLLLHGTAQKENVILASEASGGLKLCHLTDFRPQQASAGLGRPCEG